MYISPKNLYFSVKSVSYSYLLSKLCLGLMQIHTKKRLPSKEPKSYNMMAINPPEPSLMILSSVSFNL